MYNEKVLNAVQIGLPGFSAMYHYTKFGMASPAGSSWYNFLDVIGICKEEEVNLFRLASISPFVRTFLQHIQAVEGLV